MRNAVLNLHDQPLLEIDRCNHHGFCIIHFEKPRSATVFIDEITKIKENADLH